MAYDAFWTSFFLDLLTLIHNPSSLIIIEKSHCMGTFAKVHSLGRIIRLISRRISVTLECSFANQHQFWSNSSRNVRFPIFLWASWRPVWKWFRRYWWLLHSPEKWYFLGLDLWSSCGFVFNFSPKSALSISIPENSQKSVYPFMLWMSRRLELISVCAWNCSHDSEAAKSYDWIRKFRHDMISCGMAVMGRIGYCTPDRACWKSYVATVRSLDERKSVCCMICVMGLYIFSLFILWPTLVW